MKGPPYGYERQMLNDDELWAALVSEAVPGAGKNDL